MIKLTKVITRKKNYVNVNNVKITDLKQITTIFNNFFCTIGLELSSKISPPDDGFQQLPKYNNETVFKR